MILTSFNGKSVDVIKKQIENLVKVANIILQGDVGNKFLAAAQSSAYASSSAAMLKFVGIKNNLIQGSESDAAKAVGSLLNPANLKLTL